MEKEEVHVLQLRGRSILVVILLSLLGEELIEELGRSLHQHQTAILGAIGGKVNEALNSLHSERVLAYAKFEDWLGYPPLPVWVLITVWPWAPVEILSARERDVDAVEGAKQLLRFP